MAIDRDKARSWSKDRIKEELSDLRRQISEYYEEIHDLKDEIDEEMAGIESGTSPRARSSDPYKHTDAMDDAVARDYDIVTQKEIDLEFLKSLLDDTEGKKAETKILPTPATLKTLEQYEYRTPKPPKPIPRGWPGPGVRDTGDYRARAGLDQYGMPRWAKGILWLLVLGFIGIVSGIVIWLFLTTTVPVRDEYFHIGQKRILGYNPVQSPDGKKVSFRTKNRSYIPGGPTHISIVNADGSNRILLTTNGGNYAWSPDGKKIAFVVGPLDSKEVHVVNTDSTNRVKVSLKTLPAMKETRKFGTISSTALANVAWSPDGKEIGVEVLGGPLSGTVYIINADGSNLRQSSSSSWYVSPRRKRR